MPAIPRPALEAALRELDRARLPLFIELEELRKDPDFSKGEPERLQCLRPKNGMRITPLEAIAIARALRALPALRRRLPAIRRRLRAEVGRLRDTTARQPFDCPLLEKGLCLVHEAAKPIGCLAWNPGRPYSDAGWFAFARRDALNDALFGRWALRVIPLQLEKYGRP
jgi:hypothetical protein